MIGLLQINIKRNYIQDKGLTWAEKGMITYFVVNEVPLVAASQLIKNEEDEKIFNALIRKGVVEVSGPTPFSKRF